MRIYTHMRTDAQPNGAQLGPGYAEDIARPRIPSLFSCCLFVVLVFGVCSPPNHYVRGSTFGFLTWAKANVGDVFCLFFVLWAGVGYLFFFAWVVGFGICFGFVFYVS